jgi:tetratricopeptide (TPR) repeat protein
MWQEGDARVLCQYLDASTDDEEGKSTWSAWTTENEPLARVLWPEVARLARGDLYLLIPPLMQAATAARDAVALRRDLNGLLARSYERLADTERELGHWETAIRFYTATLEYDPGRVSALRGRAMCYDSVGKTLEAAGDRKQLDGAEGERRA